MKYIKKFEMFEDKLKKYIEINLLNLTLISKVIKIGDKYLTVQKLYTYDNILKTLTKNDDEPSNLLYDNFTKETIGRQSDNIDELLNTLEIEQDINKYNL